MDRLEFSESIDIDRTVQLKDFFNEIMGLYNLIADYKNVSVSGSVKDQEVSFDLLFKTEKESKEMHSLVNMKRIYLYGSSYMINSNINKKTLTLQLICNEK